MATRWSEIPPESRDPAFVGYVQPATDCAGAISTYPSLEWRPCGEGRWHDREWCAPHAADFGIAAPRLADAALCGLPPRVQRILRRYHLTTVTAAAAVPDDAYLQLRNFGRGSLAALRAMVPSAPAPPQPEPARAPCPMCNGSGTVALVVED